MIKKLLILTLVILSVLSCSNSVLKPNDFSEEEINKKYTY